VTLLLRAFVVQAFYIPSGSMEDTLQVGDRVLVNKIVHHFRDIRRGEIVVFDGLDSFTPEFTAAEPTNPVAKAGQALGSVLGITPPDERDFIKRVVGVAGDRVRCCDAEGRLIVNGHPIDEPYLHPGDAPSRTEFDIVVPPGRLWVMGDHRSRSADSRAHLGDPGGGTVPTDKVIGRAFAVVWPLDHRAGLGIPATFDDVGKAAAGAVHAGDPPGVPDVTGCARRWGTTTSCGPARPEDR
jgi:signal peptidase I